MNDTLKLLTTPTKDFELFLFDGDKDELLLWASNMAKSLNLAMRKVRGRKMVTYQAVLDEFAAAFQFGEYFGENGNAFDECLADCNIEFPDKAGLLLVITEPEMVVNPKYVTYPQQLEDFEEDDLDVLQRSFGHCAENWSEPYRNWTPYDHDPLSFKVLLPVPLGQEHLVSRWNEVPKRRIGADVDSRQMVRNETNACDVAKKSLAPPADDFEVLLYDDKNDDVMAVAIEMCEKEDLKLTKLRGRKMTTLQAFFDECSAAFQFGENFPETWDGLEDHLLTFGRQLPSSEGLLLLIVNPELLLTSQLNNDYQLVANVNDSDIRTFQKLLVKFAGSWSQIDNGHNGTNELRRRLTILLQVSVGQEHFVERWNEVPKRWIQRG